MNLKELDIDGLSMLWKVSDRNQDFKKQLEHRIKRIRQGLFNPHCSLYLQKSKKSDIFCLFLLFFLYIYVIRKCKLLNINYCIFKKLFCSTQGVLFINKLDIIFAVPKKA